MSINIIRICLKISLILCLSVFEFRIWKDMSLNDSLSDDERAKLAVWDYPVSDKYTKIWSQIIEAGMPTTFAEGIERVKRSDPAGESFAFIGKFLLT